MAGKPFKVGRFAHTLRIRLMREHLGVDVDSLYEEDLMANDPETAEALQEVWDPDTEQQFGKESGSTTVKNHLSTTNNFAKTTASGLGHSKSRFYTEDNFTVLT